MSTNFIFRIIRNHFLKFALSHEPNLYIGGKENPYMRRWYYIPRNRFLNIYIHNILRSDDDRALHDHPWWSLSLCLNGEMLEITPNGKRIIKPGNIIFRRAKTAHRLVIEEGMKCQTLFITGPKLRTWGFHCRLGWVPFHYFVETEKDEKGNTVSNIGRGCGEFE